MNTGWVLKDIGDGWARRASQLEVADIGPPPHYDLPTLIKVASYVTGILGFRIILAQLLFIFAIFSICSLYKTNQLTKGQLISKPIYDLLTSPKKRTDEFDLFAFLLFTANKSNSSVHFFGESTARQSAF